MTAQVALKYAGKVVYQPGSNQEKNFQCQPQNRTPILRAGEMGPFRSHNQPILHAETDVGNEGWWQQPNQYYPNPPDAQYPLKHVAGNHPHAPGGMHQMQPGQYPHPARVQYHNNDRYGQQPYQGGGGGSAYIQPSGSTGYPPYSSAHYHSPYPNQSDNYHMQPPNDIPAQHVPVNNPFNLDVGSVVHYGDDPNFTGVIKRIDGQMAGVEMVI